MCSHGTVTVHSGLFWQLWQCLAVTGGVGSARVCCGSSARSGAGFTGFDLVGQLCSAWVRFAVLSIGMAVMVGHGGLGRGSSS